MVGNLKYIIMKICIGLCDIFYIDIAFKNKPSFDVAIFCIWSKTKILESSVFELWDKAWGKLLYKDYDNLC